MERGGLPVDADIGHMTSGAHEFGTQLETGGYADRLNGDVDPEAVRELMHESRQDRPARC